MKCEIVIQVPPAPPMTPPEFVAGSRFQGGVALRPDADVRVSGAKIAFGWCTQGRGNRHKMEVAQISLPAADLVANQAILQPFDFTIPIDGPISWMGKYVGIVWLVTVDIDIPWRVDPHAELPVVVRPRLAQAR